MEKVFSAKDIMWLLNLSDTTFRTYLKKSGVIDVKNDLGIMYYTLDSLILIYNYRFRKRAKYRVFESKMNFNEVPL